MKIVVIGGTGLIGSKVVNILRQRGHEVVAASPSSGVNTLTGEGLAEALKGAQVVVDVANSPSFEDKPALDFFETSGRNLLSAEKSAASLAPHFTFNYASKTPSNPASSNRMLGWTRFNASSVTKNEASIALS